MSSYCVRVTASTPGAIAGVVVAGEAAPSVIEQLTGRRPTQRAALCDLGGIDEGLAAALSDRWCLITPHGGPRVVQRLMRRLAELGASPTADPPTRELYRVRMSA